MIFLGDLVLVGRGGTAADEPPIPPSELPQIGGEAGDVIGGEAGDIIGAES